MSFSQLHVNMSISGFKDNGSTQLDPPSVSYSHTVKTLFRTHLDTRPTSTAGNVHVKSARVDLSKVQTIFLLGLTLTFIIMASYALMWDKKPLLTPPPFQHHVVNVPTTNSTATTTTTAATTTVVEVSSQKTSVDMKKLVRRIQSKLEYPPRKLPDEKDIIKTDPHLFSVIPRSFLPGIKSPCWYEEFSGKTTDDPYRNNYFAMYSKSFSNTCETLRSNFRQQLHRQDGKLLRLRCLPYFYIVGQPKCGTTDLFFRLTQHPELNFLVMKEPHWWTRKRFGYINYQKFFMKSSPVEDYLDLFDLAAQKIQASSSGKSSPLQLITGEASASTMWDNQVWFYLSGKEEETEPPFLVQDFIHLIQPGAKIITILRDPTERLYSDYLYFNFMKTVNKSAEDFHQKVVEAVQLFQSCLLGKSLRTCVYSPSLAKSMHVHLNPGLYVVYLLDWLNVFPREQILVLRLEDYSANLQGTLESVFSFLNASPVSPKVAAELTKNPPSNARRLGDRNLGPMLPSTRNLLREFYQPFNRKLAAVLNNTAFLWRDDDVLREEDT
uniref:carbohydrate sulfotransferase 15-like n=1 Tax=Doryrhamphus excisus TaxID=161450 RepID=UPI0025ADBD5F|nr:carbohydrate sulfotransferase 15-like [Doryrhamphus excisus]